MISRSALAIVALSALVLSLTVALLMSLGLNWALANRPMVAAAPEPLPQRPAPFARPEPAAAQRERAVEREAPERVALAPEVEGERTPNLQRVAGLTGEFVRGAWPSGAPMFEAQQRRDGRGQWSLDGRWTAWHPNGEIEELGRYSDGREDGDWQWWYDNGQLQAEGRFERGVRVGTWVFWHENGAKLAEGAYREGERSGPWRFWTNDGELSLEHSGVYRAGARVAGLTR